MDQIFRRASVRRRVVTNPLGPILRLRLTALSPQEFLIRIGPFEAVDLAKAEPDGTIFSVTRLQRILRETMGYIDRAQLDAYLVPWPAHARSGAAAGSFEPYLLGGLGAILTRPVSVVDPANRRFDSSDRFIDLCFGLGARIFVAERVAFTFELRDLIYPEKIESGFVSRNARDPSTWYDPRTQITNAVQVRVGASFFVAGR